MKKVISFSLWGDNPKYTVGAIRNAELLGEVYDGWVARYYVGTSVPLEVVHELQDFENVELVRMGEPGDWGSLFWRFYPASEPDVEAMVSRDTDSRLNEREFLAVQEWIDSPKGFHIMRDHPGHSTLIMAGMWGAKKNCIDMMVDMITLYVKSHGTNVFDIDQRFLRERVWPVVQGDCMVHDEIWDKTSTPFPSKRIGYEFVGQVFDEFNRPSVRFIEGLKREIG